MEQKLQVTWVQDRIKSDNEVQNYCLRSAKHILAMPRSLCIYWKRPQKPQVWWYGS